MNSSASDTEVCPSMCFWQKSIYSEEQIRSDSDVAEYYTEVANALACLYVDTERFDAAEPLHREVLELAEK